MSQAGPDWAAALEHRAPDVVACWRAFDWSAPGVDRLRVELDGRVRAGDAPRLLAEQEALGDALEAILRALPEGLLRAPGGEEDWNVAQAFAHTTAARRFLVTWASLDAAGQWREDRSPEIVPSVPGRPHATREELLVLLDKSRRAIRDAAARIAGHELDPCRMRHPLIGQLRCGDWLLFIGIHDLMHLEQLHRLRDVGSDLGPEDAGGG